MDWKSSDVVRFDLGHSFKVKWRLPNLKVCITRLLLVLEVWDVKPTYIGNHGLGILYRKSWAGSLLMWLDLSLGPSFKVKWGLPNLSVYNSLIIGPRGLEYETIL